MSKPMAHSTDPDPDDLPVKRLVKRVLWEPMP